MPSEVQFRRGSESENNNFLGAEGELSVNTSNNALRVHNGISTGGFELAKDDLSNVGIVTQFATEKLSIGNTEVLSLDFQLKAIAGIDSTTKATLESSLQLAPNNFDDLNVTGIGTIGGQLIVNQGASITGNASITGVVTAASFNGNLNASGVSTITSIRGTDVNYTNGYVNAGVVTTISGTNATYTTGSFTTGYVVTGVVTTLSGTNITFGTGNFTTNYSVTGVVTTISGTNLTYTTGNIGTGYINTGIVTAISGRNLSYTGVSTFSDGPVLVGSGTSTGTATQRLQVTGGAYVSGNTGIGTINPSTRLEVFGGDIRVGINTSEGLILTASNGTKYRLIVSTAGVVTTVLVP